MTNKVLVINAGSSTIKWKLFDKELNTIAKGTADRIFVDGTIETSFNGRKHFREVTLNNFDDAVSEVYKDMIEHQVITDVNDITNIGYRVVQGGDIFSTTTILDEEKINQIDDLSILAPLHNPGAVKSIKAFSKKFPNAKRTATFDTSFHTTIDKLNYTYPINKDIAKKLNIRKYGAHGTSHKYITHKVEEILGKDKVNIISMHIGNGASLAAVEDSKSIDTSMGLTPLAGIMMGTRSGDIDPSIIAYATRNLNISAQKFEEILNKESGLLGVSGISQDMRDIVEAMENGNEDAKFTHDLYVQRIVEYTINYINKLKGNVDALVFTAGVAENNPILRKEVINNIHLIDVEIDDERNESEIGDYKLISTDNSKTKVYVIRTDEEWMIAKENLEVK